MAPLLFYHSPAFFLEDFLVSDPSSWLASGLTMKFLLVLTSLFHKTAAEALHLTPLRALFDLFKRETSLEA